jgi:hypothetical protein
MAMDSLMVSSTSDSRTENNNICKHMSITVVIIMLLILSASWL